MAFSPFERPGVGAEDAEASAVLHKVSHLFQGREQNVAEMLKSGAAVTKKSSSEVRRHVDICLLYTSDAADE